MAIHTSTNLPAVIEPIRPVGLPLPPSGPAGVAEAAQAGVPLTHYVWLLRRHLWKMLAFIAICIGSTIIVSMRMVPVYEAVATVDIDRQSPSGIIGQEANRATVNDSEQFLSTQVKLIQSDSVLRPVAVRYNLLEREAMVDRSDVHRWAAYQAAPVVLKKLKITRPPNTYLMLVTYRSTDPKLAADVANAVAQSYIAHTYNLRFRASASLSSFMEKQLEELKAKMERSMGALAQFEKELNVINPEEKTSILSARLLQLNTEFTNAQSDRVRKQASYQSLSTGSMEAALASAQGESLRKLTEHLNETQERFAQVKLQFGANHPEHKKAAGQLIAVQSAIEATRATIIERGNVEFAEASRREQMLSKAVAETKAEFDKLNARSFEYQQLKRDAEGDKRLYDELVRRIREAGINATFQNSSIRLADTARPPAKPVFPNIGLNIALAAVISVLLTIGAAILSDALDNTVRDPEEVARTLNTTVIGTLPVVRDWRKATPGTAGTALITARLGAGDDHAASSFGEAVRTLRNSILLSDFDRRMRTLLITSASPAEGKSTTAVHLALAHAEQGKKTLLIDGDLRRPSVHRKLGITSTTGLSDVLLGETEWNDAVIRAVAAPDLDIMPAGRASRRASDLVGSEMVQLLDKVAREYDLVIIDAPPLLGFAEPLQMATSADAVLIVARAGETNRKAIASVVTALHRLRVNVLGLVLNEVRRDHSDSYYYYGAQYYRYYAAATND